MIFIIKTVGARWACFIIILFYFKDHDLKHWSIAILKCHYFLTHLGNMYFYLGFYIYVYKIIDCTTASPMYYIRWTRTSFHFTFDFNPIPLTCAKSAMTLQWRRWWWIEIYVSVGHLPSYIWCAQRTPNIYVSINKPSERTLGSWESHFKSFCLWRQKHTVYIYI